MRAIEPAQIAKGPAPHPPAEARAAGSCVGPVVARSDGACRAGRDTREHTSVESSSFKHLVPFIVLLCNGLALASLFLGDHHDLAVAANLDPLDLQPSRPRSLYQGLGITLAEGLRPASHLSCLATKRGSAQINTRFDF